MKYSSDIFFLFGWIINHTLFEIFFRLLLLSYVWALPLPTLAMAGMAVDMVMVEDAVTAVTAVMAMVRDQLMLTLAMAMEAAMAVDTVVDMAAVIA